LPRWWWIPAGLLAVALLLGFVQPLASDTSVYLLQTRTLLETGNRYIASHDSKGPLMVWLTAPAVRLLGAGAVAAGALRALAALGTAAILYGLIRAAGGRSRRTSIHFAALAAALPYSAVVWGDSLRPETYAILLTGLILLLGRRGTPGAAFAAGAVTGAILFLKSILVLPALAMLVVWLVLEKRKHHTWPLKSAACLTLGALLVAALALGWLAKNDSLAGWYRQTVTWPTEFRDAVPATVETDGESSFATRVLTLYKASDDLARPWWMPIKVPVTLLRTGIWPFFLLAIGLILRKGMSRDRVSLLALGWIAGALLELCLEYRRWAYPAAGLLPPLLLWIALAPENGTREGHRIGLTWLCASILLVGITTETTRLFQARLRGTPQSPYEALALAMRPHYQPGETLLVLDNNYALHLLLPAPAPPPILSLHVAMVSPGERETLRQRLEVFPPTWIASKNPAYSGIRFGRDQPETVAVREQEGALILSGPYRTFLSCSNAWARRLDAGAIGSRL
jgi:4-amino-4-deoxy-L-arabinose transferase-like glycosyltransferase